MNDGENGYMYMKRIKYVMWYFYQTLIIRNSWFQQCECYNYQSTGNNFLEQNMDGAKFKFYQFLVFLFIVVLVISISLKIYTIPNFNLKAINSETFISIQWSEDCWKSDWKCSVWSWKKYFETPLYITAYFTWQNSVSQNINKI